GTSGHELVADPLIVHFRFPDDLQHIRPGPYCVCKSRAAFSPTQLDFLSRPAIRGRGSQMQGDVATTYRWPGDACCSIALSRQTSIRHGRPCQAGWLVGESRIVRASVEPVLRTSGLLRASRARWFA